MRGEDVEPKKQGLMCDDDYDADCAYINVHFSENLLNLLLIRDAIVPLAAWKLSWPAKQQALMISVVSRRFGAR